MLLQIHLVLSFLQTGYQSFSQKAIIPFNRKLFSCQVTWDSFVTPWTAAHQAPLSMEFSRQEYWSGLPFHPPRDLSDPGIEPASPALAGLSSAAAPPGKPTQLLSSVLYAL